MQVRHALISSWRMAACLALAIAAFLPATSQGVSGSSRMSRAETVKATQALAKWFDCDSCGEADLKAVTRHKQAVVPSLVATLNAGLSPANRQALHDSFGARYDELDAQGRKDPKFKMKSTKDEFIARYVDQYDALYRMRAAEALGAIGGANARAALKTALTNAKSADVRKAIQEALQTARQ